MNNKDRFQFRIWDKQEEKMLKTVQLYPAFMTQLLDSTGRYIILQATGLQDANGIDIHEGDLLISKERDVIFEVYYGENTFDKSCCCFCVLSETGSSYPIDKSISKMFVTGNAYENIGIGKYSKSNS